MINIGKCKVLSKQKLSKKINKRLKLLPTLLTIFLKQKREKY